MHFWLAREAGYRAGLAKKAERANLAAQAEWLDQLPLSHMVKFGWVRKFGDKATQVSECLKFFGVASVETWREQYESAVGLAAFKASPKFKIESAAVAAWLRKGAIDAARIQCDPFDKSKFRAELDALRNLTNETNPPSLCPYCRRPAPAPALP